MPRVARNKIMETPKLLQEFMDALMEAPSECGFEDFFEEEGITEGDLERIREWFAQFGIAI